ncbi:MAG: hypothetical protein QOD40_421 [Alphaproteobacteria bacterium]|nr:hypothetical protein [Alphaproteobacteria bacterium]
MLPSPVRTDSLRNNSLPTDKLRAAPPLIPSTLLLTAEVMPMLSASTDDDCRRYPAIARDDTVPSHALERIAALPLTRNLRRSAIYAGL